MKINELPLLELFQRLRNEGFPLGIEEYQLLLKSLQGGFGVGSKKDLANLCCTLWVKSAEEKLIFDHYFNQIINNNVEKPPKKNNTITYFLIFFIFLLIGFGAYQNFKNSETSQNSPETKEEIALEPNNITNPNTEELPSNNLTNRFINTSIIMLIILPGIFFIGIIIKRVGLSNPKKAFGVNLDEKKPNSLFQEASSLTDDEIELAQIARQLSLKQKIKLNESLSRKLDNFPVTRRQMKQSWRYLRRFVREGPLSELDIEATVKQIGSQGFLTKPILVPRRVNRTELLLLLDKGGSMVPFQPLSSRIAETARLSGRLGKTNTYYFHNCPIEYLYNDLYFQDAQLIENILPRLHSRWTVVLIFSDAGAARRGYNSERVEKTVEFLEQIKKRIRRISWLNPMPRSRWKGTTAEEIARFVPMFEISKQGLQNSINILRGK